MKNSAKYKKPSKKNYNRQNWEKKKKTRKAAERAAAAAAGQNEIHSADNGASNLLVAAAVAGQNGASNVPAAGAAESRIPLVQSAVNGASNDPAAGAAGSRIPLVQSAVNGASNDPAADESTNPAVHLEETEASNAQTAIGSTDFVIHPAESEASNAPAVAAVPIVHSRGRAANNVRNQGPTHAPAFRGPTCTTCRKKRREPVEWTADEVAMLKTLLLRKRNSFKKPGPWAEMRREGEGVFNKCRTGGDLRDKWENVLPHWLEQEAAAQQH